MTRAEFEQLYFVWQNLTAATLALSRMMADACEQFAKEDAVNTALEQQQQRAENAKRQRQSEFPARP